MSPLPLLRPPCECPELRRKCPVCRAYDREEKPLAPEALEPVPVGRPVVLPSRLVAVHDDLVARIAAGERYSALAQRYGVTEDALRWYLKRTGAYVPRAALKAEQFRTLAPQILAELAAGQMLATLAAKYKISTHAIRCMRQRAEADVASAREGRHDHCPASAPSCRVCLLQ